MLWAIDVGNTNTTVGRWDGEWRSTWRLHTDPTVTEDELAATLGSLNPDFSAEGLCIGSVNPAVNAAWQRFASKYLDCPVRFVGSGKEVGLEVTYDPPSAVGADRIANALAALDRWEPPIVVVDFGTATTFDSIDGKGRYVGGAIMAGVETSRQALVQKAAKLPQFEVAAPERASGRNVTESLQSGLVFGTAGAVDSLVRRIDREFGGGSKVYATGGLGGVFAEVCETVQGYEPMLTLDGLRIAWSRLG